MLNLGFRQRAPAAERYRRRSHRFQIPHLPLPEEPDWPPERKNLLERYCLPTRLRAQYWPVALDSPPVEQLGW